MKRLETDAKALAVEVVKLWKEGKLEQAKQLCDEKITELLAVYKPSTVSKDCQKVYRKSIIEESGVTNYREFPVSLFKVPDEILISVNQKSKQTTFEQRSNLIKISESQIDKLLEVAINLLNKPIQKGQDAYDKACALILLTGRRPYSEVLHNAKFKVFKTQKVLFSGQAKGGEEKKNKWFEIPVLGTLAEDIVKAQNDVTEYIINRDWYNDCLTDKEVSGNCKKQLQLSIDRWINPILLDSNCSLSPHDLRKLYAFICWERLNLRNSAFTAYAPTILLHTQQNKLGQEFFDTQTSECYEKFKLVEFL